MAEISILNASDKTKTTKRLAAIAKHAKGTAKATIQGLSNALKENPTAGRARRSKEPAMKKRATHKRVTHTRKTHTRRRKTRTNPTASAGTMRQHLRGAGGVAMSRIKGVNVMSLITKGATIAGGMLAQNFVATQSAKFLPSMPKVAHQVIGAGVVAAASVIAFGGKAWAEDLAAASIAAGIQGVAKEFLPSLFSGVDDDAYVQGFGALPYDENGYPMVNGLGEVVDQNGYPVSGLEGLAFSGRRVPAGIATRPAGF